MLLSIICVGGLYGLGILGHAKMYDDAFLDKFGFEIEDAPQGGPSDVDFNIEKMKYNVMKNALSWPINVLSYHSRLKAFLANPSA